jgi:DNA-binding MarR family transcriptional regulator
VAQDARPRVIEEDSMGTAERETGRQSTLVDLLGRLAAVESRLHDGIGLALSEERASLDEWRILELVARLEGPTMGELAHASSLPNASLSRVVDALEDSASVYRLPGASDRRRITVHLSSHGADRLGRMRDLVAAWEHSAEQRVGASGLRQLADALHSVETRLRGEEG